MLRVIVLVLAVELLLTAAVRHDRERQQQRIARLPRTAVRRRVSRMDLYWQTRLN